MRRFWRGDEPQILLIAKSLPFAVVSEALKSPFEQSVNFEANPPDFSGSDV
jgi:hypothetical protein